MDDLDAIARLIGDDREVPIVEAERRRMNALLARLERSVDELFNLATEAAYNQDDDRARHELNKRPLSTRQD